MAKRKPKAAPQQTVAEFLRARKEGTASGTVAEFLQARKSGAAMAPPAEEVAAEVAAEQET